MNFYSSCILKGTFFMCLLFLFSSEITAQYIQIPGVGWKGQGAGITSIDINNNGIPDLVLMAYDDPKGANSFRYKIGCDVDANGKTNYWTSMIQVDGVGWEGQGAGITSGDIDRNGKEDLILMAYDNPKGANSFRYRIGYNINGKGEAAKWGKMITVSGVGHIASGAGIALTQLDGNSAPDLILMAYDNPEKANTFRYKVGWNLDHNGQARKWSKYITVSGMGWEADGAGVAVKDLNGNGMPEIILMAYDAPKGTNSFRYKIGWDLNQFGIARSWGGMIQKIGVGHVGEGADILVEDLDGNGISEFVLMAYDAPNKENFFRYFVVGQ